MKINLRQLQVAVFIFLLAGCSSPEYTDLDDFMDLVKRGIIQRPHYALGLLLAAKQAFDLGYKKIKVFELGCYNLERLLDLENYATDIKQFLKIDQSRQCLRIFSL